MVEFTEREKTDMYDWYVYNHYSTETGPITRKFFEEVFEDMPDTEPPKSLWIRARQNRK